jgi:hypothetical protein
MSSEQTFIFCWLALFVKHGLRNEKECGRMERVKVGYLCSTLHTRTFLW